MRASRRFYYLGLALVVGLSFGLRFWQLGRFNALVFDEVYYVKFAQAYLAGERVFDAHPPMGKVAIAAGIWLYGHTPWLHSTAQAVTADVGLAPVSYRWMNALVGALVPLVVVGLARSLMAVQMTSRALMFAVLAGAFVAIDGLFVTESRYGLLNIYVVFFGLLGHWLWMVAVREKRCGVGSVLRGLSGVALGAAIATKWNGLGYVLALVIWQSRWEGWQQTSKTITMPLSRSSRRLRAFAILQIVVYLGLLPLLTYCCLWWPHLQLNEDSFLSIHRTLFLFHQGLDEVQVACSRWFTWPLLIKPIAYWYEQSGVQSGVQAYTVNNLGNPLLWWFSGAVVLLAGIERLFHIGRQLSCKLGNGQTVIRSFIGETRSQDEVAGYLLIGYLANWLPWMVVSRCTYIYLYMPAAVFGFMLLAWLLSSWLSVTASASARWFGCVVLIAIALAFLFWLPLSLGSPLTLDQLQMRWWLPSWI